MNRDKIAKHEDWIDGIDAFRNKATKRLEYLEGQLTMLMERIKDLEEPPKAPHPPRKEKELKL